MKRLCLNLWVLSLAVLAIAGQLSNAVEPLELITPRIGEPELNSALSAFSPVISGDGRVIVFSSASDDLVPNRANSFVTDLFVWDRSSRTNRLIPVNVTDENGPNADCFGPMITRDGRLVMFLRDLTNSQYSSEARSVTRSLQVYLCDLQTGTTLLASVLPDGSPVDGGVAEAFITPDGRYLVYSSTTTKILSLPLYARVLRAYRRDLQTGETILISKSYDTGMPVEIDSLISLSDDGQRVGFLSHASDLAPSSISPPNLFNFWVRDVDAGTNLLVGTLGQNPRDESNEAVAAASGLQAAFTRPVAGPPRNELVWTDYGRLESRVVTVRNGQPFSMIERLAISADGAWLAFLGRAAFETNVSIHVWHVTDGASTRLTGGIAGGWVFSGRSPTLLRYQPGAPVSTETLKVGSSGLTVRRVPSRTPPSLSDDGSILVFDAAATDLGSGDLPSDHISSIYKLENGQTSLISRRLDNHPRLTGNGPSHLAPRGVSDSGRFVLFTSVAGDLVPNDTNGCRDVFLRDRQEQKTILISTGDDGSAANGASHSASMTPDGRYVAFVSAATNLVVNDTNRVEDVFVRDAQEGTTTRVSARQKTVLESSSLALRGLPLLSPNGQYVAFGSRINDIVGRTPFPAVYIVDIVAGNSWLVGTNDAKLDPIAVKLLRLTNDRVLDFSFSNILLEWDTQLTEVLPRKFPTRPLEVGNATVSHDGNTVVYLASDGTIVTYDRAARMTNHMVKSLDKTYDSLARLGFSLDHEGRRLAFATFSPLATNDLDQRLDVYLKNLQSSNAPVLVTTLASQAYSDTWDFSEPTLGDDNWLLFRAAQPWEYFVFRPTLYAVEITTGRSYPITPVTFNAIDLGGLLPSQPASKGNLLVMGVDWPGQIKGDFNEILSIVAFPWMNLEYPGDSDHDTLPDDWERRYFGDLTSKPESDPDGDGLSNSDEALIGTNPTDPTSKLQIALEGLGPNTVQVGFRIGDGFHDLKGLAYQIQSTVSLDNPNWQPVQASYFWERGSVISVVAESMAQTVFFRVVITTKE